MNVLPNLDDEHWNEDLAKAPQDGTTLFLKGRYPDNDVEQIVIGRYDSGGYTEGWIDSRGFIFYANSWMKYSPVVLTKSFITEREIMTDKTEEHRDLEVRYCELLNNLGAVTHDHALTVIKKLRGEEKNAAPISKQLLIMCLFSTNADFKTPFPNVCTPWRWIDPVEGEELYRIMSDTGELVTYDDVQAFRDNLAKSYKELNEKYPTNAIDTSYGGSEVQPDEGDEPAIQPVEIVLKAIPMPYHQFGMQSTPPIYSLNQVFMDLANAVEKFQSLSFPMPKDRKTMMEFLQWVGEIDTQTLKATEGMDLLIHLLNDQFEKCSKDLKQ